MRPAEIRRKNQRSTLFDGRRTQKKHHNNWYQDVTRTRDPTKQSLLNTQPRKMTTIQGGTYPDATTPEEEDHADTSAPR